jgi:hypothetical protein
MWCRRVDPYLNEHGPFVQIRLSLTLRSTRLHLTREEKASQLLSYSALLDQSFDEFLILWSCLP